MVRSCSCRRPPVNGVVIGHTNLPLAHEGEALFNIGLTTGTQIVARTLDGFDPLRNTNRGRPRSLRKQNRKSSNAEWNCR